MYDAYYRKISQTLLFIKKKLLKNPSLHFPFIFTLFQPKELSNLFQPKRKQSHQCLLLTLVDSLVIWLQSFHRPLVTYTLFESKHMRLDPG